MTPEEVEQDLMTMERIRDELKDNYLFGFKFVKVGDDYRFLDIMDSHTDAIDDDDELPLVDGAGTIVAYEDGWKVEDAYSMTILLRLKELGMDQSKAAMNSGNYDFFTKEFGKKNENISTIFD